MPLAFFPVPEAAETAGGLDWRPVAGTLAGAVLGFLLAWLQNLVSERRQARKAVDAAAFECLDALRRLDASLAQGRDSGSARAAFADSAAAYRGALANAPRQRPIHMAAYRQLRDVATAPDPANVRKGIETLERLLNDS